MANSKVVMNVNIGKVNYCIFTSKDDKSLTALAIRNSGNSYFVTDINEVNLLNTVINMLNKKYIRRKDIVYNNKKLARFEHRYSGKSFFAEITLDNNLKDCSYEEYKDLYDTYNGIKIMYARRKDRRQIRENRRKRRYSSHDINFDDETYDSIETSDEIDDFLEYNPYSRRNSQRNNRRYSRNNNAGKKIVLAIGGTVAIAVITAVGLNLLSNKELPPVVPDEKIEESSVVQNVNNVPLSQIQKEYGENVIIKADNEEKENLQEKYKKIEKFLKEKGLSNWEICAQLDGLTALYDDIEKIDFYYDSEKDEIVYVFEELNQKLDIDKEDIIDESKENDEASEISSRIQIIINAINENKNLSDKEKKYIIKNNLPIWIQNEKYINVYEIADRYRNLKISYQNSIANVNLKNTPYTKAAGTYSHGGILLNSEKEYNQNNYKKSEIKILDASSIENVISQENGTLNHELNHINGEFSYHGYSNTLLNEGYTQLAVKEVPSTYITEQCMAVLFIETFGSDVMKEGYYGFDLNNAITNKIVEKTGKDNAIVNDEIYNFLQDTQDLLYDSGKYTSNEKENEIKDNKELVKRYESLFKRLESYYEIVNERKMSENQIVNLVMDCITGSNKAKIYRQNENYKEFLSYDLNTGLLVCNVGNSYQNMELLNGDILAYTKNTRKVELNKDNKYSENYFIKDSDINYSTR